MKTIKKIEQFCKENNFKLEEKSILVACSGGVDSMVLVDILSKIKTIKKIGIAHCNFSLRAAESDEDEEFITQYAYQNAIEIHSIKFDTKKIAKEKQKSIQLTARELRYNFFEKISLENNYDFIATAHHLSDSLETSVYHLSKGTGIAGLRGILPKRKLYQNDTIKIIRPLLCITKNEIIEYAQKNNLKWREDASNKTEKYKRNFIRHSIVPKLKEINPEIEKTFLNTSERLRALENLLHFHLQNFEQQLILRDDESLLIPISVIESLTEPLLILSEFLKKKGFSYKQSKQILQQLQNPSSESKTFFSPSYILYTKESEWLLSQKKEESTEEKVFFISSNWMEETILENEENSIRLKLEKCSLDEIDFSSDAMYADLDKLKFPLELRKWQNGDRFVPLGMKNSKTLGNFLTDEKIPVYDRDFVYVLLSENKIVWVGMIENHTVKNLRIDDRFKLKNTSKNIIRIT